MRSTHVPILRAGVIGAGTMGARHARCHAHRELTGVFDIDCERARAVATRYATRHHSDLDRLVDDIDVVSVASLGSRHLERARHALELVEQSRQPMAAAS